eukprot:scaffold67706_cov55-Phaeocystis_antarctica.AAC.2
MTNELDGIGGTVSSSLRLWRRAARQGACSDSPPPPAIVQCTAPPPRQTRASQGLHLPGLSDSWPGAASVPPASPTTLSVIRLVASSGCHGTQSEAVRHTVGVLQPWVARANQ